VRKKEFEKSGGLIRRGIISEMYVKRKEAFIGLQRRLKRPENRTVNLEKCQKP